MKNKWAILAIMWIVYGTLNDVFPVLDHDLIALIPLIVTICLIFDFHPHTNRYQKKEKAILKKIEKTGSLDINENIHLQQQGSQFQDIVVYYGNEKICKLISFKDKFPDKYKEFLSKIEESEQILPQSQKEAEKVNFPLDEIIEAIDSYNIDIMDEEVSLGLYNCSNQLKYLRKLLIEYPLQNPKISKLEQYYLPILIDILENYVKVSHTEEALHLKTKLNQTLVLVNEALRNITNSLFDDEKLNLNADMNVLKSLLKKDGLVHEMSQNELKEAMEKTYE